MTDLKEFVKIATKLKEGNYDHSELENIFEILEAFKINIEILKKTQIGLILNNFRKDIQDNALKNRAKNLIKKWKAVAEVKTKVKNTTNEEFKIEKKNVESLKNQENVNEHVTVKHIKYPHILRPSHTNDECRNKMRTLLFDSLNTPHYSGVNFRELACAVEDYVFEEAKGTNNRYTITIRNKIMNLKGKYKDTIKDNLFSGTLTAHDYATMDYTQYCGEELKQQVKKYVEQAKDKNTFTVNTTSSTMYQCAKCKERDTSFTQAQTRSADEPMTTFIRCNKCGHRWKQG